MIKIDENNGHLTVAGSINADPPDGFSELSYIVTASDGKNSKPANVSFKFDIKINRSSYFYLLCRSS